MAQPQQPYQPPQQMGETPQQQFLDNLPFYRRNGVATALLLIALVLGFGGPFLLAGVLSGLGTVGSVLVGTLLGAPLLVVCVVVLTGDIYYDAFDAQGQPKTWGVGNKVVAVLIIGGWIYSIVSRFF